MGLAAHATLRVKDGRRELAALFEASRAEGASFVATLQGEHAERQRLALDRRRALALSLAAARRDRLLGIVAMAGAGVLALAASALARISGEIERDRREVNGDGEIRGPDRS
jgi:hypothetical protein